MRDGEKKGKRQGVKEGNEGRERRRDREEGKGGQWPFQFHHHHFLLCTFLQRFLDSLCPSSYSSERPICLPAFYFPGNSYGYWCLKT